MYKRIPIDEALCYKPAESGMFSAIVRDYDIIKQATDRLDAVLKVFFNPIRHEDELADYDWGRAFKTIGDNRDPRWERSNLLEAVKIQNICSFYNLAPRVYDIVLIEYEGKLYPALVVEELNSEVENTKTNEEVYQMLLSLGKKYGFSNSFSDVGQGTNLIEDKWVDFQAWYFTDDYVRNMIRRFSDHATWSGNTYQEIPELETTGYRGSERAALIEYLKFNPELFKGKDVVDVGCSGGFFTRIACRAGAKRVAGFDLEDVIPASREVSNYLGCFNIDWFGGDFEKTARRGYTFNPEVVIFLSVYRYFGFHDILKSAKTVIYEHNGDVDHNHVIKEFKDHGFKIVKEFGVTGKNDVRRSFIFQVE